MKRTLSIAVLLLLTLVAQAQTRHLRVYQHSGNVDTLTVTIGSAFTHSKTDLSGTVQPDFVTLDVQAVDATRRYRLADIDSLVLPGGRRVVFRGATTTEQAKGGPRHTAINGSFPGTKGTGNVQFLWTDNDPIRLDVGYESRAEQLSADKTSAQFVFDADDLDADAYTVYYPDKRVTIPTVQTQQGADNSDHLGISGDCGVATAQRGTDGNYTFTLAHKAAYLCFLPHIDHLPSVRLTGIDVERASQPLAGTYTLTADGLYSGENTSRKISLRLEPQEPKDFFLGHLAATEQDSVAAYMVIRPYTGTMKFTATYHLTDTLSHVTTNYVQTFSLATRANTVYTVTCNIPESVFRMVDLGSDHLWANVNAGATVPNAAGDVYALADSTKALYTLGTGWQLPSAADVSYLLDQCIWTTGTYNGQQGWMVSGTTKNERQEPLRLFLPYADYWTATPETTDSLTFSTMSLTATSRQQRYEAVASQLAIRPVTGSTLKELRIPYTGTKTYNFSASAARGIKIYDHAGPDANYDKNANGDLELQFPTDYMVYLHGSVKTYNYSDALRICDANTSLNQPLDRFNGTNASISKFYRGSNLRLNFTSNEDANVATGVDLTLDAYEYNTAYAISTEAATGGTVSVSTTGQPERTITLKAQPEQGYVLKDVAVKTATSTVIPSLDANSAMTYAFGSSAPVTHSTTSYQTVSFLMPYGDVTLTPVYERVENMTWTMPAKGTLTIDEDIVQQYLVAGVTQLKFYDDGGPTGKYANYDKSYLRIVAPVGYHMVFSGTLNSENNWDKLTITDETTSTTLIDALSGTNKTIDAATTGRQALVYFYTSGGTQDAGIDATVTFVKDAE